MESNRPQIQTNFALLIVGVLRLQIQHMLEVHKQEKVKIPPRERELWHNLLRDCNNMYGFLLSAPIEEVRYYNDCTKIIKFIMKELDSRCGDSNMKLWQFHNLLKSYPIVNNDIVPTYDEELDAFGDLMSGIDKTADKVSKTKP